MLTRAITGVFFVAVLLAALFLGRFVFTVFFSLIALLSLAEFYTIVKSKEVKPNAFLGLLAAAVLISLYGLFYLEYIPLNKVLISLALVPCIFIASLYQNSKQPFHDISYSLLGVLYAAVPFLFFIGLGFISGSYQFEIPLGFLLLLWTNDTGAYLSGRSLGKHKLFERISPNKTWEGFVGGVLLAVIVGFILAQYFEVLNRTQWVVSAVIIGAFGTLGDLVESMLKRSLGVKDSGTILPGHGGFLDRFDGLLFAAPLVYLFLHLTLS